MVTTKLNLSMTEPQVRQIYAKQGDTGRVLDISLDQTPEDGTLRILRPDGVEVTSEAVTGGEISESGETVSFESLTEADVTELTVGIEPVQDLSHGDPSPSNICPITGHDEVEVTQTGENLLTAESRTQPLTVQGVTVTPIDKWHFRLNGTCTTTTWISLGASSYNIVLAPSLPNGTYTVSCGSNKISVYVYADSDTSKTAIGNRLNSVTVNSTIGAIRLLMASGQSFSNEDIYVQIVRGTTVPTWTPYVEPHTYTTSLGQTVYGGTLDMVTGVLTVDKAEYQLSDMTATLESNNRWFFTSLQSVIKIPSSTSVPTTTISDRFVAMSNVEMANTTNIGLSVNGQGNLIVRNGSSTDQPTGQIVIPLATPVEYQLTPQQIKTLVGTNNVWASSGDIVNIKFTYGGLFSELPSDATSVVGKCYCDVEQNGVSSMPFTLNVKKNERAT